MTSVAKNDWPARALLPADDSLTAGRREPALALYDRWGGQLYWHQVSHVGHLLAGGVQAASERFLRGVSQQPSRSPE
jgi:hypothetical protein